ncbi:MAG: hypothetical protein ACI8QF_004044 [Limisphaerales bacterium]|jgi:hypothetical protein
MSIRVAVRLIHREASAEILLIALVAKRRTDIIFSRRGGIPAALPAKQAQPGDGFQSQLWFLNWRSSKRVRVAACGL